MQKSNYINGMHKETYKLFFDNELNQKIEDFEENDLDKMIAMDTIDFYSRYIEKKLFKILIKISNKIRNIDFDKITYNPYRGEYEYIDRDSNIYIPFSMLSDYTDDEQSKELLSTKRYHVCHKKSIMLSKSINKSKVLTGYIYLNSFKYLHSVVEYSKNDITYIIDWTKNVKMRKEDYFELTKFKVITSLDSCQIRKDLEIFRSIFDNNKKSNNGVYKIYATFGNELCADIEKNKQIFK